MANVPRSKPRAIRASDELWAAVDKRAKDDDVSVSDVVRAALLEYLGAEVEDVVPVAGREDGRPVRSGRSRPRDGRA